jgi:O-antigen/teichoic acid export membrane protein
MRNLLSSLLFFLARVFAAVLQLKLVERFFGSQYAGLNALLNQLAFYVALIELGLAAAAISLLYEPIKRGEFQKTSGLLFALQRDTSRLILFSVPVVAAMIYGYAQSLNTSLPYVIVLATLALTALSGLITLLSIHYQAYLNASEQIYQIHLVLGAGYLVKTAVGVGLAVRFDNYLWLPAAVVMVTILEVLTLRWRFWRSFPHYRAEATREAFAVIRTRAKYVLFHRVGGLIYYQSDFIILSLVASLALVKDYAQVQYAVAGILGLSSAVFNALTASIARRQLDVAIDTRWKQYATVLRSTYFLAICISVAFVARGPSLVKAVFHGDALAHPTYVLFACLLFLNLIKQVDDTFITATGTFHVAFYLPIVESCTYALLGIVLAKRYGIDGIVTAGIATNLAFAVVGKSLVVAAGIFDGAQLRMLLTKLATIAICLLLAAPVVALFLWIPSSRHALLRTAVSSGVAAVYCIPVAWMLVRRGYGARLIEAEEVPSWNRGAA